ncbi:FGGY-family carbohydrate kinase [Lacticaseibacillus chiayiensis]|uniref:FGGY-family carbohydrate kinase n=1 Tax=Lacticaseibacillus chiayiensis TaxID=2100821 RepID=UPI001EE02F54|nr:FGGY-family carbohydrate kinase [Lacticaseibacillus chiayiensis]
MVVSSEMVDFAKMTAEAQTAESLHSYIDPNHPLFTGPSRMEEKIEVFLRRTGQPLPQSRGQLIRTVLESLAMTYRQTIANLEKATGTPLTKIHMFGGGIQNQLLVQLTADLTQMPVSAGPIEASVTGNIVSQLLVLQKLTPEAVAATMKRSYTVTTIQPQAVPDLEAHLKAFQQIVAKGQTLPADLPSKTEAK